MWKHFLSFIFPNPSMCVCCEQRMDALGLCDDCKHHWQEMTRLEGQCKRCGTYGVRAHICDTCREWPAYYKGNIALLPYTGEVREAIVRFKFHNEPWRINGFASLIAEKTAPSVDAVIPVPLHPKRLRERGYNQSLLLAKLVSEAWLLPLQPEWLVRTVHTPHQSTLARSERLRNVHDAFAVPDRYRERLGGKRILLVDDVITTGSTLRACARILHQAGAKEIVSLTLAAGLK